MTLMFTGIIQHVGSVRAVRNVGSGRRIAIDLGPLADGLALGDSVAVSGACLTAVRIDGAAEFGAAEFDVSAETVSRTTLGDLRTGDPVNLERALRAGAGLDGHLVQGHVDGVGEITRIDKQPDQWAVEVACPTARTDEMVEKGSVAVAGVSLTITALADGRFSVALIPATWEATTFGRMSAGAKVNIETDVIGKYVRRYLRQIAGGSADLSGRPGGLTVEKLRDAGFM